jgi:peptidyl-prolyl cis-trans isomerase
MRCRALFAALLFGALVAHAQDDPTLMTINGRPVSRSEFEYSYNKNNAGNVVDKKTVAQYVDLFVNYRLKVEAALAARLDTMQAFKDEFLSYRDQQVRSSFVTNADVEKLAREMYEETRQRIDAQGGQVRVAHIMLLLPQKASKSVQQRAQLRIDSVYQALKRGANFGELARKLSDDKGSAQHGGELPWLQKGQTLKEFEDAAFALKQGEISKPVLSPAGYHVIKLIERRMFLPYDSVKSDILAYIDQTGMREQIVDNKLNELAKASATPQTPAEVLQQRVQEMEAKDPALKYLNQEYHDGLLLYEISNRTVWEKAAKDEEGLRYFFSKNKKRYVWDEPRFKGIACYAKTKADLKAVKKMVKKLPFDQWNEALTNAFNNDSTVRIRAERGMFKPGDNALVDREVFKKHGNVKENPQFPVMGVVGKKLKSPKEMDDVRALVVADFQETLEKEWVKDLRKKYKVEVNEAVLKTVNKH